MAWVPAQGYWWQDKTLSYFIRHFKIFPGWLGCVFIVTAADGTTGPQSWGAGWPRTFACASKLCLTGALPADFNISFPCNKSFLSGRSGYRESWKIPECSGSHHSQHEYQKILSQIGFLRATGAILGLKGKRDNGAQCPLEIQTTSWVTSIDYLNLSSPMGGSFVMT